MKYKEMIKFFIKKQLENLSSAKMLMFFLPFIVTTIFMSIIIKKCFKISEKLISLYSNNPQIIDIAYKILEISSTTFISFCTFTVSLGGTIIVCREVFKVQKLNSIEKEKKEEINI
jgi:Na+-driven multidrug efflux pump